MHLGFSIAAKSDTALKGWRFNSQGSNPGDDGLC